MKRARFAALAAALLAAFAPLRADDAPTPPLFRGLVVALIVVGGAGSVLAGVLAGFLRRIVAAWTGPNRPRVGNRSVA